MTLGAVAILSLLVRADCPTCDRGCYFTLDPEGPGRVLLNKDLDDSTCPVTRTGTVDDPSSRLWPKPRPGVKSLAYCVGKYLGVHESPFNWGIIPPLTSTDSATMTWIGGNQSTYTFTSHFPLNNEYNLNGGKVELGDPDVADLFDTSDRSVWTWDRTPTTGPAGTTEMWGLLQVSMPDPGSGTTYIAAITWKDPTTGSLDNTTISNNRIVTIADASGTANGTTYALTYDASRNLTNITCTDGSGNVSKTDFTLYGGGSGNGTSGSVQYLTTSDWISGAWQVTSKEYDRSYTAGVMSGQVKYVVKDANLQRMIADGYTNPDSVSDAVLSQYANKYYVYDATTGKVTQIVTGGSSGSCCGG